MKIERLKLNEIAKSALTDKQKSVLKGGCMPSCCGCYWGQGSDTYGYDWSWGYEDQCKTDW